MTAPTHQSRLVGRLALAIAAMALVIFASNILVQYPVHGSFGGVALGEILTYGAFTYPIAFLVTDITNRTFGARAARRVVFAGFALAVVLSVIYASPRIAIASGTAFLTAQLLDVSIFNRLRHGRWWRAPLISSLLGSLVDTVIFFSLAFAGFFAMLDFGAVQPGSLDFPVAFLGVGAQVPLWVSLAAGDFIVKVLVGVAMLVPFRIATLRLAHNLG